MFEAIQISRLWLEQYQAQAVTSTTSSPRTYNLNHFDSVCGSREDDVGALDK